MVLQKSYNLLKIGRRFFKKCDENKYFTFWNFTFGQNTTKNLSSDQQNDKKQTAVFETEMAVSKKKVRLTQP